MMRHLLLATVLCITALPALADPAPAPAAPGPGTTAPGRRGKPAEFQPTEMTEEEAAAQALKARQKNRPAGWKDTEAPPERPIPWMFIAFCGLALLVAAPFAMRAYNQTRRSMDEVDAASGGAGSGGAVPPRRSKPPRRETN